MSLLSVLKTVGKDLSHVGVWIEDGVKIAGPIASAVDPALAPIITIIEGALNQLPKGTAVNAATLQTLITAVAALEASKAAPLTAALFPPGSPAPGAPAT